ncbi:fimbrial protein [Variovorax ureilyticus]|uniref:Fimbrial protein n=1 Tax=Variovorax ureilyticus TaxID=1836198 RepID=A0ABU8VFL5_9BURK
MKKNLLSAALTVVIGASVVPSAFAADGKITFKGQIEDATCSVTGGAGTDGGAQDFTVTLDKVQKAALGVAGARAGDKAFSVKIGGAGETGCPDGKIAGLKFEQAQSPVDVATGRLTNVAGTAAVVQVGLLNEQKQDINLNDGTNAPVATIAGNTATINYFAQYYAPATGVTAGTVDTYVMYSVAYN